MQTKRTSKVAHVRSQIAMRNLPHRHLVEKRIRVLLGAERNPQMIGDSMSNFGYVLSEKMCHSLRLLGFYSQESMQLAMFECPPIKTLITEA